MGSCVIRLVSIFVLFVLVVREGARLTSGQPNSQFVIDRTGFSMNEAPSKAVPGISLNCSLSQELVKEIANYTWLYQELEGLILKGPLKGITYERLATFVDTFGERKFGSQSLEDSIDYLVDFLRKEGLENVHTENVSIPGWERGNESLYMLEPRYKQLSFLGLGSSVGTPPEGIAAEVIVVKDFDELKQRAAEVPGKIVVYNQPYLGYSTSVKYRQHGATEAAKLGGVAALIRSITPRSIYSPHTGWQDYEDGVVQVPAACITVEDAEMFDRMTKNGVSVKVKLMMEARTVPNGMSRNTVAEWRGAKNPEEVVIVSGHLDSWDVGQGAMDDGGGAFISLMVPLALQRLGLRSRRTLRAVLWTAEEPGYYGALAYKDQHKNELGDFNVVMESDTGTFDPAGLQVLGSQEATCIVQEVLKLAAPLKADQLKLGEGGSDSSVFSAVAIPTAGLMVKGDHYFDYHHSPGDTMSVEDPNQLDRCLVLWALTSYVFADLSVSLPRNGNATETRNSLRR